MAQQIRLEDWLNGDQGIVVEGGLSGLANRVLSVMSNESGMELSDAIAVSTVNAGTLLSVSGAGPFNSLEVDGNSFTSVVDSTFSASLIMPNISGAAERIVAVGTDGVFTSLEKTGTGDIVLSDSPTLTGTVSADDIEAASILAGTDLRVSGSGPFEALVVTGSDLTSVVDSTFSANVILPNLSGASQKALLVGTDGVVSSEDTTGTGSVARADSPTFTGNLVTDNLNAIGTSISLGAVSGGSVSVGNSSAFVGFFGTEPVVRQSITETSADAAITELQDILIAYGLAIDAR